MATKSVFGLAKYWLFCAMYFCQGVQYGFLGAVIINNWLPRGLGAGKGETALFASAMMWPWLFKAVMAVFADRFRRARKAVLLACTLGMSFALISIGSGLGSFQYLLAAVVFLSVLRATQDVTTDSLAFDLLPGKKEWASGQSVMWLSNFAGSWFGGAGMLMLRGAGADYTSLCWIAAAIIGVVGVAGLALGGCGKEAAAEARARERASWKNFGKALAGTPVAALAVAFAAHLGSGAFTKAFLGQWFREYGYGPGVQSAVGTTAMAAMMAGAVLAGFLGRRWHIVKLAVFTACLVAGSYAIIGLLAPFWRQHEFMVIALGLATIGDGMWPVVLCIIFGSLAGQHAAATRYAVYAGVLNASLIVGPLLGGAVSVRCSYPVAFAVAGVLQLVILVPLWWLRLPREE